MWRDDRRVGQNGVRAATHRFPKDGPTFCRSWGQQPDDIVVTKQSWGAFATTDLEYQLKARGITQAVVTGVVTSGGVEATARQATSRASM